MVHSAPIRISTYSGTHLIPKSGTMFLSDKSKMSLPLRSINGCDKMTHSQSRAYVLTLQNSAKHAQLFMLYAGLNFAS